MKTYVFRFDNNLDQLRSLVSQEKLICHCDNCFFFNEPNRILHGVAIQDRDRDYELQVYVSFWSSKQCYPVLISIIDPQVKQGD